MVSILADVEAFAGSPADLANAMFTYMPINPGFLILQEPRETVVVMEVLTEVLSGCACRGVRFKELGQNRVVLARASPRLIVV